jgi:D-tyrosyl-tRNA(Tyr) deacylase
VRAVVQRVTRAHVEVEGARVSEIERGLLVLVGVAVEDEDQDAIELARKIAGLRIFEDADGRMNRSLVEVGGALCLVSQFTLLADVRKGRRPSFGGAAPPERAELLFERVVEESRSQGIEVSTGRFRTTMEVELVNHGPVTILIDTARAF